MNFENIFFDMIIASLEAGKEVLDIYKKEFEVFYKDDETPLTLADKISNDILKSKLRKYNIFILSEEENEKDFEKRKGKNYLFIVDPLDGTKEFIKKNGEFTINIALIKNDCPIFGVVYAPALKVLYFGGRNLGSYKLSINQDVIFYKEKNFSKLFDISEKIETTSLENILEDKIVKVCVSKSHLNEKTLNYLEKLKEKGFKINLVSIGSSLKFCLVAEGKAHFYPRLSPTMEWDTAAAQAVLEGAGGKVVDLKGQILKYNKRELKNPSFLAFCKNFENILF